MNIPVLGRIGMGLIIAAGVLYGSWTLWWRTRTWCPVDVPMPVSSGSHVETPEFKVNLNGPYEIVIQVERKESGNTLSCLLGGGPEWPQKTCEVSPVVKLRWSVTTAGQFVAEGHSEETGGEA